MINGHHFANPVLTSQSPIKEITLEFNTAEIYWRTARTEIIIFEGVKGIRKIPSVSAIAGTQSSIQIGILEQLNLQQVFAIQASMNQAPMSAADSLREALLAKNKGVDLHSKKRYREAAASFALSVYVYGRDLSGGRNGIHRVADTFMVELLTLAAKTFAELMRLDPAPFHEKPDAMLAHRST